ncbi:MAG: hypothetical protein AB7P04_07260 [Bacteriovoracia bacterium]
MGRAIGILFTFAIVWLGLFSFSASAGTVSVCFENDQVRNAQVALGKGYDRDLLKTIYSDAIFEALLDATKAKRTYPTWESAGAWEWIEDMVMPRLGPELAPVRAHIKDWLDFYRLGKVPASLSAKKVEVELVFSRAPLSELREGDGPLKSLKRCAQATLSRFASQSIAGGGMKVVWTIDEVLLESDAVDALNVAGIWLEDVLRFAGGQTLVPTSTARAAVRELFTSAAKTPAKELMKAFSSTTFQTAGFRASVKTWVADFYREILGESGFHSQRVKIRRAWLDEAEDRYVSNFEAWLKQQTNIPSESVRAARSAGKWAVVEILHSYRSHPVRDPLSPDSPAIERRLDGIPDLAWILPFPERK